ncbi:MULTISPECIES: hypothetical protein [unclassified Streptomyces]|uniref:hypothetical protein n=1 Tax=unclassified Streptomyces TaxID=2593676 RepID=UPI002DD945E0|nr:hypothetical protein [Streptomyces sp. NBC_01257]WRZ68199.1 hypothetical protein OG408_31860 [Streptomyces sp. NBC_01257]WSU62143.1 hypothetical protein OG450_31755 [Streptomyces sp. NBC_01104]
MRVGAARAAAVRWVAGHARSAPGYRGAYFSGSTVGRADDARLAPSSDVDVVVVTEEDDPPAKPGKLRYEGALLEITYVPWAELRDAGTVLSSYHLAGSFRVDTVIDDPTGGLRALYAAVAPRFAEPDWVRRRCLDARRRVEGRLAAFDGTVPFHEQVPAWMFPTGVTTHVLLVAALRNPTVRLRYRAARDVLTAYGQPHLYRELLELLGCADVSAELVRHHAGELTRTFDATVPVARTPFFFSSDLTEQARPIAVDGSLELIGRGEHREAVFWIVATLARCHTVLAVDDPALHAERLPAFRAAVADLTGITGTAGLLERRDEVLRFLPRLDEAVENVLAANPDIAGQRPLPPRLPL